MTAPIPRVTRLSGPSSLLSVPEPASASSDPRSLRTKSDMIPPRLDAHLYTITGPRIRPGFRSRKVARVAAPDRGTVSGREGPAIRRYIGAVPRRSAANSRAQHDQGRRAAGATERASRLYDSLRNLIVRGQLAPGARIVETEVAERFGVSRTPVRAAFQRLEREGYVTASATHQARMTVAPLTKEDVGELLDIVGELGGGGARSAGRVGEGSPEKAAPEPG